MYLQQPKTSVENLIKKVSVISSPKKRSNEKPKQKMMGKVTLLHAASLGRLEKFSTLDVLNN